MDIVISKKVHNLLCQYIDGEFKIAQISEDFVANMKNNDRITLNFSGGLDSLAAYLLMRDSIDLVSITFGKSFEREERFFHNFDPWILSSNFRTEGLSSDAIDYNHMGIGSILANCCLHNDFYCYGSILEATPFLYGLPQNPNISPLCFIGMKKMYLTEILTEIATFMIVAYYAPNMVAASLQSIAAAGSEKLFRKALIANVINRNNDYHYANPSLPQPKNKIKFGSYFATDFLSLYLSKFMPIELNMLYADYPKEARLFAKNLDLSFYECFNSNYLKSFPNQFKSAYIQNLIKANVLPYTLKDWQELRMVVSFLKQYYPNLQP